MSPQKEHAIKDTWWNTSRSSVMNHPFSKQFEQTKWPVPVAEGAYWRVARTGKPCHTSIIENYLSVFITLAGVLPLIVWWFDILFAPLLYEPICKLIRPFEYDYLVKFRDVVCQSPRHPNTDVFGPLFFLMFLIIPLFALLRMFIWRLQAAIATRRYFTAEPFIMLDSPVLSPNQFYNLSFRYPLKAIPRKPVTLQTRLAYIIITQDTSTENITTYNKRLLAVQQLGERVLSAGKTGELRTDYRLQVPQDALPNRCVADVWYLWLVQVQVRVGRIIVETNDFALPIGQR